MAKNEKEQVRFSFAELASQFKATVLVPNTRSAVSTTPQLSTTTSKDTFQLTRAGYELMKLNDNSSLRIADYSGTKLEKAFGCRFALVVGNIEQGGKALTPVNNNFQFTYVSAYGSMLVNEDGKKMVSVAELLEAGLMIEHEETNSKTATRKVTYDITPLSYTNEDDELVEAPEFDALSDGNLYTVFALVNRVEVDHTPTRAGVKRNVKVKEESAE